MDNETALAVVDDTEELVGLAKLDNIHKTSWVAWVGTDFAIDLNKAALDDSKSLLGVEGVLKAIAEEDHDWKALAHLVWASRWVNSEFTGVLGEHPVVWGSKALEVLTLAARHERGQRLFFS